MNDLSVKIRSLRGKSSQADMAKKCGVSTKTITNLEKGDSVKLETLRSIKDAYRLKDGDWLELVTAWIKKEVGADAAKMWIEPIERQGNDQSSEAMRLQAMIHDLNAEERRQLLFLLQRPAVRRVLPSLNKLYDALNE